MFGLLNIDKPPGITSRDVVNRVQRLVRPHKAGHAGTLDPLATGVLVVAVGQATRLIEYVQRMPKTYAGTFLLGKSSDTEDIAGQVVELSNPVRPTEAQLGEVLPRFVGTISQQPPNYSALKVRGQPAYALARRGVAVDLAPREIEVYEITLVRYEYPELELRVCCGSGTYVRSLGRDLARALGTEAVMSALVRKAIGPFDLEQALAYEDITAASIRHGLLPPRRALEALPQIQVTDQEAIQLRQGKSLARRGPAVCRELVAVTLAGELVAVVAPDDGERLKPLKCFAASQAFP